VLAGAKVAFQYQIGTRGERAACHGEEDGKTRIAQPLGMRGIRRAQHIKQRFLDEILAEEQHAMAPRQNARQCGLAAAWQSRDEEHAHRSPT